MEIILKKSNRKFYILIGLIVLFFFIYHAKNFKLDASSDTLILQNDESFQYFNFYNNIFPSKNFLVLAVQSKNIIDNLYIKNINKLKNDIEKVSGVESIYGIINIPILFSNNIKLTQLSEDSIETINDTQIDLDIILKEFSENPIFKDQIININKDVSAIIIYLKKDEEFFNIKRIKNEIEKNNVKRDSEYKKIIKKYDELKINYNLKRKILISDIRKIINNQDSKYKYYLGGIDMIADDTLSFVKKDIIIFSISVFIFIFIVLFLIFKSLKWVLIPLITSSYAIITMIGLTGFLNWEITAISSNFISLMLILSISMNIHIINNYRLNFIENNNNKNLKNTVKKMFWPCFYTALTTIVAFASLLFSDIKPVIDFGKIMIFGLLITFITSFTILPLLISLFPIINQDNNHKFTILSFFYINSIKNYKIIYLINFIIFVTSILGIYKLNVENSFINYFKQNTEIYRGMKLIDQELGGTTPLDIVIKFNDNEIDNINEIFDDNDEIDLDIDDELDLFIDSSDSEAKNLIWFTDEKIEIIKKIHLYLENKDEIGKVLSIYSLIDLAEKINKNPLNSFELSVLYSQIPENYKQDLISPYLSIENNMVKITARVKDSEKIKREDLILDIENYLDKNFNDIVEAKVNGLLVLYNNMLQSLFSSQIKSFTIVILSIFIMFIILFKSIKLSIIGIIPNIIASTSILGFIGIAGIPLDIMTITIAAITIGIAVDNTIHYLYRVRINIISNNMDIKKSIENSHNNVGQAVLTTSLTIAFGFSVLCLSNFIPTILFGLFTAMAMIIAMLGVMLTLPAILVINKI